ncbi:MAG: SIS domain-containing protein [Saprospiraceae bacterium]|nr:SIS domain-containing protein [Saprospiraceae bacterium]MCB9326090.1 SIS domain-containing protein [Lewinellaceae bacterium]
MKLSIKSIISESITAKQKVLADEGLMEVIEEVVKKCIITFEQKGKILFCGNGGSAADAQHLAGELSGRFFIDREPLFAEALHVNTSFLTAMANDYSFEEAYARMVRAAGRPGDILFALSTSGNSENIIRTAADAQKIGMIVVGMTGETGGKLKENCDFLINIPSLVTPRIQECHIMVGHIICELVEKKLFG